MHRTTLAAATLACTFSAAPLWATFGCDVIGATGASHALHQMPDASSPIMTQVPVGKTVSLFDEPEDAVGEWVRVAYSEDQTAFWGEGIKGWIHESGLGECG